MWCRRDASAVAADGSRLYVSNAGIGSVVKLTNNATINTNVTGTTLNTWGGAMDFSTSTLVSDTNLRDLILLANGGTGGNAGSIDLGTAYSLGSGSGYLRHS